MTPAPTNGLDKYGAMDGDGGLGMGGGYEALWERFMKYKNRVPVCGGILLDEGCQSVSFPYYHLMEENNRLRPCDERH